MFELMKHACCGMSHSGGVSCWAVFLRLLPTEGSWLKRGMGHWLGYADRKDENGGRASRMLPCSMSGSKKGARQGRLELKLCWICTLTLGFPLTTTCTGYIPHGSCSVVEQTLNSKICEAFYQAFFLHVTTGLHGRFKRCVSSCP